MKAFLPSSSSSSFFFGIEKSENNVSHVSLDVTIVTKNILFKGLARDVIKKHNVSQPPPTNCLLEPWLVGPCSRPGCWLFCLPIFFCGWEEEGMTDPKRLQGLIAGATEAEADPDRHRKEEAVLATVAKVGLVDQVLWYGLDTLAWSRADYAAIAKGIWACILDGVAVHPDTVKARLPKDVPAPVLTGILDGSKAVDVTVAKEYIRTLTALNKRSRALDAGRKFLTKVKAEDTETTDLAKLVCGLIISHNLVPVYLTEAEIMPSFYGHAY